MTKGSTLSYYITKYFSDFLPNQTGASVNTIQSYRDTFVQLFDFFHTQLSITPEDLTYTDFSSERIEAFLDHIEKERGVSVSTRNQRLAAIHAFFRFLQYRDPAGFASCKQVLAVPYKKAPVVPMNYMSIDEIKFLFSIPDQKTEGGIRDLSIMVLLYETGARVQEVIDLTPGNIRFGKISTVELHGKGNKTRVVPIDGSAASIIRKYIKKYEIEETDKPLFTNKSGKKLTRAGIQYIVDKYTSMAHEEKPEYFKKRITNHSFRHSRAMHLLESGVNLIYIRDFMGHVSVVTTEVYAKTNPKIKEDQIKKHAQKTVTAKRYSSKEKKDLLNWLKSAF